MKIVISDLFGGLTKVTMGRMRFFIYQIVLFSSIVILEKIVDVDAGGVTMLQASVALFITIVLAFCGLNTMAKRVRDIGVIQAWLFTIALLIVCTAIRIKVDNVYLRESVDYILIICLAIVPTNFTSKKQSV